MGLVIEGHKPGRTAAVQRARRLLRTAASEARARAQQRRAARGGGEVERLCIDFPAVVCHGARSGTMHVRPSGDGQRVELFVRDAALRDGAHGEVSLATWTQATRREPGIAYLLTATGQRLALASIERACAQMRCPPFPSTARRVRMVVRGRVRRTPDPTRLVRAEPHVRPVPLVPAAPLPPVTAQMDEGLIPAPIPANEMPRRAEHDRVRIELLAAAREHERARQAAAREHDSARIERRAAVRAFMREQANRRVSSAAASGPDAAGMRRQRRDMARRPAVAVLRRPSSWARRLASEAFACEAPFR